MRRSPLRYERFLRVPFPLVDLPSSRHRYVRLVLRLLHVGHVLVSIIHPALIPAFLVRYQILLSTLSYSVL